MKLLILGAVLALLLLFPQLLPATVSIVAGVAAKPVAVAFILGLVVRPYLRRPKGWTR
ncbi:hypothetical protein [Streptomyces chartreusis]|uniref:Uncharacterized protein n=1 Tax=Streptomyces chartreusis TaxID=1969 RepID=A0A7H8TJ22_STRCX|nr:hypothetical protein [Streptomyces chartreusis]QKZ22060.1 hypothetical protein HUT05_34755 [Streptomyces chartreusis]